MFSGCGGAPQWWESGHLETSTTPKYSETVPAGSALLRFVSPSPFRRAQTSRPAKQPKLLLVGLPAHRGKKGESHKGDRFLYGITTYPPCRGDAHHKNRSHVIALRLLCTPRLSHRMFSRF